MPPPACGQRGRLLGFAVCLLCRKAWRTAVCVVWPADSQDLPRPLGPAQRVPRGPCRTAALRQPPAGTSTGPRPLLPALSSLEALRSEAALVPGGRGLQEPRVTGGGASSRASLASLPPPPTDPMTPGPVSSRKAMGLQGRPVCEPERLTGLPRARGSLLSGQAPAGPSCAASPDSCRPVNSWLWLLAGEIQCFCKNQKLLDFPIPCPVALRETQEAGPRSCEAFPPRHACLLQGRLRFLLGRAEAAGKNRLSVPLPPGAAGL